MWRRALVIVGNETKRGVALAVISGHLAEYRNIPQDFLVGAVFEGLLQADRVKSEVKSEKGIDDPQIVMRAKLAKDLLVESGILRVPESEEYRTLGKGMWGSNVEG